MTAPKPDRSAYRPNFIKTAENPQLDIGWNEGFLTDGRPYRVECWAEDQVTSLTFFFSTSGLEGLTNPQFAELLEREGLVRYRSGGRRSAYAMPLSDPSGNSLWSVNVVIGDDEETFVDDSVSLRSYSR